MVVTACNDTNACAFTVGNHITFNRGEYDPSSKEGQHVLAHELAHVRQQTGGAVPMLPQEGELAIDPDEQLEREAEETAERVMRGGRLGIHRMRKSEVHVQRAPKQTGFGPDGEISTDHFNEEAVQSADEPSDEEIAARIEQIERLIEELNKTPDKPPEELEERVERLEDINVDQIELIEKGDMGGTRMPGEITEAGVRGGLAKGSITLAMMLIGGTVSAKLGMDPQTGIIAAAVAASGASESIKASWDWCRDHRPGADTWEVDEIVANLQKEKQSLTSELNDTEAEDPTGVREQ